MALLTRTTLLTAILLSLDTVSALTLPNPLSLSFNLTRVPTLPSLGTSVRSRYWYCARPPSPLGPTTYHDCDRLADTLALIYPTLLDEDEVLFSPREVADIRLPFYLRWGTCLLDLKGVREDSWDVFPMRTLLDAMRDLAAT